MNYLHTMPFVKGATDQQSYYVSEMSMSLQRVSDLRGTDCSYQKGHCGPSVVPLVPSDANTDMPVFHMMLEKQLALEGPLLTPCPMVMSLLSRDYGLG